MLRRIRDRKRGCGMGTILNARFLILGSILVLILALVTAASCTKSGLNNASDGKRQAQKAERTNFGEKQLVPVRGGTVTIGLWNPPAGNFSPFTYLELYDYMVVNLVFDSLFAVDESLRPVPALAERWEVSNDNGEITFYLRKDVKWHDGQPFTARDVEFTFLTMLRPDFPGTRWLELAAIKGAREFREGKSKNVPGIEVIDDYTIKFKLSRPYAPLFMNLSYPIAPKHLLTGKSPEEILRSNFNSSPVGTGPFKFVRYQNEEYVELAANEEYYAGRPYLDKLVLKVTGQALALEGLLNGSLDMTWLLPGDAQQVMESGRVEVYSYPDLGYQFLGLNLTKAPFNDKRVRQALAYAINRDAIVSDVLGGYGTVINAPMPPSSWAYDPNVKRYPFDPSKAKSLLGESGWIDSDGDGVLEKDGREFKFTLTYPRGDKLRELVAPLIQGYLSEVGIRVELNMMRFDDVVAKVYEDRDFDAFLLGWSLGLDPDPSQLWHSVQASPGGWNAMGFVSRESDALIEKGLETLDPSERREIYSQWQKLMSEELPVIPLYSQKDVVGVSKRVGGFSLGPQGLTWSAKQWWIREKQ